jgi:hypothetical protein
MSNTYSVVKEIEKALDGEAYLAALALALTIPDMCCGHASGRTDYIRWFDQYAKNDYINGTECYALRCSFLHQQEGDINCQEIMKNTPLWFMLDVPDNKNSIRLQLNLKDEDAEDEKDKNMKIVNAESLINGIIAGYKDFIDKNPDYVEGHPGIVLRR